MQYNYFQNIKQKEIEIDNINNNLEEENNNLEDDYELQSIFYQQF